MISYEERVAILERTVDAMKVEIESLRFMINRLNWPNTVQPQWPTVTQPVNVNDFGSKWTK
jgi:hypothetical protein